MVVHNQFNRFGVVIGVFLVALVCGCLFVLGSRQSQLSGSHTPADTLSDVTVIRRVEVDGAPYLIWSNGQITPNMAEHRQFVLRTLAAQALLESQSKRP